ncbi:ferredoxin [Rhodococcus sp. 05-339-2]|nr:ferredoxin [Rhodococcus sp. 05-339-2]
MLWCNNTGRCRWTIFSRACKPRACVSYDHRHSIPPFRGTYRLVSIPSIEATAVATTEHVGPPGRGADHDRSSLIDGGVKSPLRREPRVPRAILPTSTTQEFTMAYQLLLDTGKCQGYANCLIEAPQIWDFDEENDIATLKDGHPGEDLRSVAEASVRCCPARAISMLEG